jgi:hypothetical protein
MGAAKTAVRHWTIRDQRKHWDSLSGLKQANAHTGALYQENKGPVKLEQRPATMSGKVTHKTLPPKTAPLQTGSGKQHQV